jgi:DNA-binding NarL/FixJ family response regulator
VRPTTVAVIARTRLYRDGVAHALSQDERLAIVAVLAGDRDELELLAAASPNMVLLDMASHNDLGQLHAMRRLLPETRIVVLGAAESEELIIGCAEAGVSGYVEAQAGVVELIEVVHAAMRDEVVCSPRLAAALLRRIGAIGSTTMRTDSAIDRLTRRELEILDLIDDGLSNKEIAQSLQIQLGTVKTHVHSVLDKLEVQRRSQAAARRRELEAHHVFASTRRRARSSNAIPTET